MVKVHSENSQSSNFSTRRLHTSEKDKIFLGVLGGLAEYLSVDATFLRLIFIILLVLTGFFPGVLLYFVAAVIMPKG